MRFCVSCCFQFKKTKKKQAKHHVINASNVQQLFNLHMLWVCIAFLVRFKGKSNLLIRLERTAITQPLSVMPGITIQKKQNKTKEHYNIHRVFHLDAKGPSTVYTAKALWMCTLRTDEFGPVTATITVKLHMREYKRLRKSYTALVTVNRLGGTLLGAF